MYGLLCPAFKYRLVSWKQHHTVSRVQVVNGLKKVRMSFSKSKRFSYSVIPGIYEGAKDISNEEKRKVNTSFQRNATYTVSKEDKRRMNTLPIVESTKGSKTLKKIANKFAKTLTNNVFTKKQYNVRKETQKVSKKQNDDINLNYSFTWDDFESELANVRKSCKELGMVLIGKNNEASATQNINWTVGETTDSAAVVGQAVKKTSAEILELIQDSTARIQSKSERKVDMFLKQMIAQNAAELEEMRSQCQYSLEKMTTEISVLLEKNSVDHSKREDNLECAINVLSEQLEDSRYFANYLEESYAVLVRLAEKKILQQTQLIDTLNAELEANEISERLQKIIEKQIQEK